MKKRLFFFFYLGEEMKIGHQKKKKQRLFENRFKETEKERGNMGKRKYGHTSAWCSFIKQLKKKTTCI